MFYKQIIEIYEGFDENRFLFDFDIQDMVDFVTPYVKIEFIASYKIASDIESRHDQSNDEKLNQTERDECPLLNHFTTRITEILGSKSAESEHTKFIKFLELVKKSIKVSGI